jgi:hypothetical protein
MNGSWLQHLEMQLLNCLTCENYREACTLLTAMSMYFSTSASVLWFLFPTVVKCILANLLNVHILFVYIFVLSCYGDSISDTVYLVHNKDDPLLLLLKIFRIKKVPFI